MNEIIEMIYQWHQGVSVQRIGQSLGFDRNTVRKYIRLAQSVGVSRGVPFPPEGDLVGKLKAITETTAFKTTPERDMIVPHREWICALLQNDKIAAKQVWRLFQERAGIRIGYCTMLRYLKSQFQWGRPAVTVRIKELQFLFP